ncbi:VWA domain-containing protein [Marinicrinis sediminis]|uniref:VWA domain-containing protein n=1 Tax=Marinicrinis sediminis TaxID=1652465 RepID=A0ABW5RDW6_9BACL
MSHVWMMYLLFIVSLASACTIWYSLYRYRSASGWLRWMGWIVCTLIIAGIAAGQISSTYSTTHDLDVPEEVYLYQAAYWLEHDDSLFAIMALKEHWEKHPSIDSKALLALAYIQDEQLVRGYRLLQETSEDSDHLRYVKPAMVTAWLEQVQRKMNVADTSDRIDTSDTSDTSDMAQEIGSAEDKMDKTKWQESFTTQLQEMRERTSESLSEWNVAELDMVAVLAMNRIQYLDGMHVTSWMDDYREAISKSEEKQIQQPFVIRTLSKASLYNGDYERAEQLLVDLVQSYPQDSESIAALSELYMSGKIEPGPSARMLPQYQVAVQRAESKAKERLKAAVQKEGEEQGSLDEVLASSTDDNEQGWIGETLSNELAYALLEPLEEGGEPSFIIDARMARYFFNDGDSESSAAYIHRLKQKADQMTVSEQRVLHQLEQLPELTGGQVLDTTERTRQIELRKEAFHLLHAPQRESRMSVEDESFAYHLQEQLRYADIEHVAITNIEASDDGEIVVYLRTENIQKLKEADLALLDQGLSVDEFKLEKLDETVHRQRSVGLVMDVSGSMEGDRLTFARQAAASFVQNLQPFEQAELVAFSDFPDLIQDLTDDRQALTAASLGLTISGGTDITQALTYEIDRMAGRSGQRIVLIFTDGEDEHFALQDTRAGIIQLAVESGTPVYAVGFGAGYDTLSEIAASTGGKFIAAPNLNAILDGFGEVAATLEQTYRLTYQLDMKIPGEHKVELFYKDQWASAKTYCLISCSEEELAEPVELDSRQMFIQSVSPKAVHVHESKGVKVTLEGKGMDRVNRVMLGKLSIQDFQRVDEHRLTFSLPAHLKEGNYPITLYGERGEHDQAMIHILEPGMMQSVKFGWATVYGRTFKTQGEDIEIVGNPSVDHFLYPSGRSDQMRLKKRTELNFEGLELAVDETQLPFVGQQIVRGQAKLATLVHPQYAMKVKEYGESFSLSYQGSDKLTYQRFGLEFMLAEMTYTAQHSERPGKLQSKAALSGWSAFHDLQRHTGVMRFIEIPAVPNFSVQAGFEQDNVTLNGAVEWPQIGSADLLLVHNPSLKVDYQFKKNKLRLSGGLKGITFLRNNLSRGPVSGGEVTVGFEEGGLKALGVTLTGNYPLGASGLTVNRAGLLVDWSSSSEARLDVGFGTIVDTFMPFLYKLNEIKILHQHPFRISSDLSLIELQGQLGIKNFAEESWEATGKAETKFLGFTMSEQHFRMNQHLFETGIKKELFGSYAMDGKLAFIYEDPLQDHRFSIFHSGSLRGPQVNVKAKWLIVPSELSRSGYSFIGKALVFKFNLENGELEAYE